MLRDVYNHLEFLCFPVHEFLELSRAIAVANLPVYCSYYFGHFLVQ